MDNTVQNKAVSWRAWFMWGLGASFFFVMYLARMSPGVMSIEIMKEFQLRGVAMGGLSMAFFYPYVLMQIPAGILVDRYGPRFALIFAVFTCAIASYLFSHVESYSMAMLSRTLLGLGASFAFVCALKLAAVWFPPERIGFLAGLTQTLGMLGAASGEKPVAAVAYLVGWRSTLQIEAILFLLLGIVVIFFAHTPKRTTPEHTDHAELATVLHGLKKVLQNPYTWLAGLYAGLLFAPTAAFAEMWGNYFLRERYGFDIEQAALCIGMVFLGWGIGGPIAGWISDQSGRRKPVMLMSPLFGLLQLTIIIFKKLPVWLLMIAFWAYGMTNTGVVIAYAMASEINPRYVAGISLGVANMLSILIGALFEPLIGWLLDILTDSTAIASYSQDDFRKALTLLPLSFIASVICWYFVRETFCRPTIEEKPLK